MGRLQPRHLCPQGSRGRAARKRGPFRGTFENAAVGISNIGRDGAWLRVNQRLCQTLGYSRAELLQKRFQDLTHPEDLPSNLDQFTALMRGEIDTFQVEKRYLHKDGHAV